jgi:hypothetical protein
MLAEIIAGSVGGDGGRLRVGDYAKSWIESKARGIDGRTADRYVTALELHILPVLGDYYLDALTSMVVQRWLNGAIRKFVPRTKRPYDGRRCSGGGGCCGRCSETPSSRSVSRVILRGGSSFPS